MVRLPLDPVRSPRRALAAYDLVHVFGLALAVLLALSSTRDLTHRRPPYPTCDVFHLPGYLKPDLGEPRWTGWHALTPCPAPPKWIDALAHLITPVLGSDEATWLRNDHLAFLQGQTILTIGDSIDRNAIDMLGQLVGVDVPTRLRTEQVSFEAPETPGRAPGWTDHQAPRLLYVPHLDLRVVRACPSLCLHF